MKDEPLPTGHALDQMMQRLSTHLDGLAAEVHRVEHAIGEGLGRHTDDDAPITQLQSLDYLRQSLEDLSLLTLMLGRRCDLGALTGVEGLQIARKLRLAVTRQILLSLDPPETFGDDHRNAGNLDLF